MRPAGLLLACATLPALLGGCVAAVVPVIAGGMVAKTRVDGKPDGASKGQHRREKRETAETPAAAKKPARLSRVERRAQQRDRQAAKPASHPSVAAGEPTPQRLRAISDNDIPQLRAPGAPQPLPGLIALPTPGSAPAAGGAPFPAFVRYALSAAQPRPGQPFRSALIDADTLATKPERPTCGTQPPAVVIDLDPGKATFDLDNPPAAAPGLAEQLAALRAAGLTVLWQASIPADQSERLYATLAATGLDPDRTDRLLLIRKPGERKQARRQAAARDWCILAIAGDSKGDFEEAFDYLRDQSGTIATALSANLGDGWFLIPQPID